MGIFCSTCQHNLAGLGILGNLAEEEISLLCLRQQSVWGQPGTDSFPFILSATAGVETCQNTPTVVDTYIAHILNPF